MDDLLLVIVGWVIAGGMLLGSLLGWSFMAVIGLHSIALRIGDLFDRRSRSQPGHAPAGSIESSAS
jgi:hypothetical protein